TIEIETANEGQNSLVLSLIASYVLAFILVLGFLVVKILFSSKLTYSFSYLWNENHLFLLFDPTKDNKDELTQFLRYPQSKNKIILTEEGLPSDFRKVLSESNFNLESDFSVYNNLVDIKINTE